MRRHVAWWSVVVAAVFVGAGLTAEGAGSGVKAKVDTTKPAATRPAKAPPPNDFDRMITVLELKGDQLAAFEAKVKARMDALEAWQKTEKGQKLQELVKARDEARKAKDGKKVTEIQTQIDPLLKDESEMRCKVRADVMSALKLDQQKAWAGHELTRRLPRILGKLDLTDDQRKQVRAACDTLTADFVKDDTIAKDPYLSGLDALSDKAMAAVSEKVLTAAQKEKLAAATSKPSTKPAAPAAK